MRTRASEQLRSLRESLGITQAQLANAAGYAAKTIQRWEAGEGEPRRAVFDCLHKMLQRTGPEQQRSTFKFIDLFAGIGGMRLGFESVGGQCVFTCEWDKYAQVTYRANFGAEPIAGDIHDVRDGMPPHDVLLAGFPCQPFSIAGVTKHNALGRPHGFAHEAQGTLFFELARIIEQYRPRAFLLENVKNLTRHDGGNTFRVILKTLQKDLRYTVHWKVIDARVFVPQHRERTFIIGFRDPNSFSLDDIVLPPADVAPRLSSILHPEDGSEAPEAPFTDEGGKVNPKYVLTSHLWHYLRDYAQKHRAQGNGFGYGLFGPGDVARTLSARYYKDGSEILIRRGRGNPRRITPREAARLMGFDRVGAPKFRIPVSDTQAYRQFGNAVVVPVVTAVARAMAPYIVGGAVDPAQIDLPLRMTA